VATLQTGTDLVGYFVQAAAEQTDRTSKAKFLTAALRAALGDLEAEPNEKIFGEKLGQF